MKTILKELEKEEFFWEKPVPFWSMTIVSKCLDIAFIKEIIETFVNVGDSRNWTPGFYMGIGTKISTSPKADSQ